MNTPLIDAWNARTAKMDTDVRFSDLSLLKVGDYAHIQTPHSDYFGFIKSVGRINVILETPYQPRPGDYVCIQDLKFKKELVKQFVKPKITKP